jgi:D-alanyl-D-alanine carboxypeptidase
MPQPRFRAPAAKIGLLFCLSGLGCGSSDELADLRHMLQQDADALTALGISGVQARLILPDGSNVVVTSGVAGLETRAPVSPDGYFRIGSSTKSFGATVVLQLAAENRLSLEDPVERWLPGVVQGNGNDGNAITIRHLLQHQSGIHDDYPTIESAEEYHQHRFATTTPEQIVARALAHPPDFAPGLDWGYANTNYVLLGMIVERVTGSPWHREVAHRITQPLRLAQTIWPGTSASLPEPHAKGYEWFTGAAEPVDVTVVVDADASGGIVATTMDLNRFFRALLGGDLLPARQMADMQRTVPVGDQLAQFWPGARAGLGLFSRPLSCGGVYWGHSGDQLGYMTRLGVTADGRSSVVVSASSGMRDSAEHLVRSDAAASAMIDRVLCAALRECARSE